MPNKVKGAVAVVAVVALMALVAHMAGCTSQQEIDEYKQRIALAQEQNTEFQQQLEDTKQTLQGLRDDPNADQAQVEKALAVQKALEEASVTGDIGLELMASLLNDDGSVNQAAINDLGALAATVAPASVAPWVPIATLVGGGLVAFFERERRRRQVLARADDLEELAAAREAALAELVQVTDKIKDKSDQLQAAYTDNAGEFQSRLSSETKALIEEHRSPVEVVEIIE